MKLKSKLKKRMMGIAGVTLAAVVAAGGILAAPQSTGIEIMASDVPYSTEKLREQISSDSSDQTYRILEIVPETSAAEIGFYVEGQEPFSVLYNASTGEWYNWKDKLREYKSFPERKAFMDQILAEYNNYYASLWGTSANSGMSPVYVGEYSEISKADYSNLSAENKKAYAPLSLDNYKQRGYFTYNIASFTDGSGNTVKSYGNYNVTFQKISSTDEVLSVEHFTEGKTTPYYTTIYEKQLTYGEFYDMLPKGADGLPLIKDNDDPILAFPLYKKDSDINGDYYLYSDTFANVYASIKDQYEAADYDATANTDFYEVHFGLINNNSANVSFGAGKRVYTVKTCNNVEKGEYGLTPSVAGEQAGLEYEVSSLDIYYKGGVKNNLDYLMYHVLGVSEAADKKFDIKVTTLTLPQLGSMIGNDTYKDAADYLNKFDMVYINNGDLKKRCGAADLASYDDQLIYTFDAAVDGTAADTTNRSIYVIKTLVTQLVQQKKPCIVDASTSYDIVKQNETFKYALVHPSQEGLIYRQIDLLSSLLMATNRESFLQSSGSDSSSTVLDTMFDSEGRLKNDYSGSNSALNVKNNIENNYITNNDMCYVSKNVWVFGSDQSLIQDSILGCYNKEHFYIEGTADGEFGFDKGKYKKVFREVIYDINNENKYRTADTLAPLEEVIDQTRVIRYIMSYSNSRVISAKEYYKVLNVQPAKNSVTVGAAVKTEIARWADISADKIIIENVAMNEFVGRIEDLNAEYDLIYFGDSPVNVNTSYADNNTKVYRSPRKSFTITTKGLLYRHTGDKITSSGSIGGLINGDIDKNYKITTRFSGNDLTTEKYNMLMDYLDASCPIIIAEGLLQNNGNYYIVNKSVVDNSSYFSEFLYAALGKQSTFIGNANIVSSELIYYLDRSNITINRLGGTSDVANSKTSLLYDSYYSVGGEVNDNVTVISPENGEYTLKYRFKITDTGSASVVNDLYKVSLYLDANADGKFSTVEEELTGLSIKNAANPSGPDVKANEIRVGETYIVSKKVPASFYGCISWELVVSQAGNGKVRDSEIGYTVLKRATGTEPVQIKVLQIYYNADNKVINLENSINGNVSGNGYTKYFDTFYRMVSSEYKLDITTITRNKFADICNTNADPLGEYDMLILGFSDGMASTDDWSDKAVEAIKKYIESGQPVLVAHDMLSPVNSNSLINTGDGKANKDFYGYPEYIWNYKTNKALRDLFGQDAYGISGTPVNPDYTKGYALSTSKPTLNANGRYDYNVKDIAYAPNKSFEYTLPEVQGFTYKTLETRTTGTTFYRASHSAYRTDRITQINDGQITNYPFEIGNDVGIKQTHNQYYTLDMNADSDNDGQTDMVVWYTLGGSAYSSGCNDVRNDYYLYTKGNITFTGMGDSAKYLPEAVTEAEAKLFINTIIAAYKSGQKKPDIDTNLGLGNAIVTYSDSLLDTNNFGSLDDITAYTRACLADTTELSDPVIFTVSDFNMTGGEKKLELKFVVQVDEGVANDLKSTIYEKNTTENKVVFTDYSGNEATVFDVTAQMAPFVFVDNNNSDYSDDVHLALNTAGNYYEIINGGDYYIRVPESFFNISGGFSSSFYVIARTVSTSASIEKNNYITDYQVCPIRCVTVELFDVD